MEIFEAVKEPHACLLDAARRMLAQANLILEKESRPPLESLLNWLLERSFPTLASTLEELLPDPPSVSPKNETMREAVAFVQKGHRDLLDFPNSGEIDPMVSIPPESGAGLNRTICDLYHYADPSPFEWFKRDYFSCVPVQ